MDKESITKLSVGDKAPDFLLPSENGNEISLQNYKGKKLIIFFYPKDMTPGCTKEACSFRDNYSKIQQKGAAILGISPDAVKSHKIFSEKLTLQFPLLSDTNKKVINDYGVWKKKLLFAKVFFGVERTTFIVDEKGIISKIFRKVRVKGHTEEVLKFL